MDWQGCLEAGTQPLVFVQKTVWDGLSKAHAPSGAHLGLRAPLHVDPALSTACPLAARDPLIVPRTVG